MISIVLGAALTISCVDGVAKVDQEEYEVDATAVIEWRAPFAFSLAFDSPGNENLPSHPKNDGYERKLPAARLRKGRNNYEIHSDACSGDPVIIVR